MTTVANPLAAAGQAQLDAAITLGETTLAGVEKLTELQLQTVRSTLASGAEQTRALLGAKDGGEWLGQVQGSLGQPAIEQALAYGRQAYDIVAATQAEVAKLLEGQTAQAQAQVQGFLDTLLKNAPAGSEGLVALVKSSANTSAQALESAQKALKQSVGSAQAALQAVTQSATSTVQAATAAPKARKVA